ncbi:hypothetical protein ACIA49_39155 [Kribbella sp. NPDC051587]|uniref:hypothetical protein n=1 Tax=Kribbella sp. NPDC051587 TaxID=3364119 RepID=UPI0037A30509
MIFARDLAAGTVLTDGSLVLCAYRSRKSNFRVDVVRPRPPYGDLATIGYAPEEWVDVRHAPQVFGGGVVAAPARHLEISGMVAAAATPPAELAAQVRTWEAGYALLGKADRMPDELLCDLVDRACAWIDATGWPDGKPQQPAAAAMTVHEVVACLRQYYPLGGWVGLLRDHGVLAPRDLPPGKKQREHHATWDKRGKNPRTGDFL